MTFCITAIVPCLKIYFDMTIKINTGLRVYINSFVFRFHSWKRNGWGERVFIYVNNTQKLVKKLNILNNGYSPLTLLSCSYSLKIYERMYHEQKQVNWEVLSPAKHSKCSRYLLCLTGFWILPWYIFIIKRDFSANVRGKVLACFFIS